jgi:hypothetical protein
MPRGTIRKIIYMLNVPGNDRRTVELFVDEVMDEVA